MSNGPDPQTLSPRKEIACRNELSLITKIKAAEENAQSLFMNVQNNLLGTAIIQARDCSQMVAWAGIGREGWDRGPLITVCR